MIDCETAALLIDVERKFQKKLLKFEDEKTNNKTVLDRYNVKKQIGIWRIGKSSNHNIEEVSNENAIGNFRNLKH